MICDEFGSQVVYSASQSSTRKPNGYDPEESDVMDQFLSDDEDAGMVTCGSKRGIDRVDSGLALDEEYSRQAFKEHVEEWWKSQSVNSKMMTKEKHREIIEAFEHWSVVPTKGRDDRVRRYFKRYWVRHGKVYYAKDVKKAEAAGHGLEQLPEVTHLENAYDAIKEAHAECGFGGQHKTEAQVHKKYANIPRCLIKIFIDHSPCNFIRKRKRPHKSHEGEDALLPDEFNTRGLVHLMEMPQDNNFHWLFYYQDQHTKFCHIRALQSTGPTEVAAHLAQIFVVQGAPLMLYITTGPEYTARVLMEIESIWPMCRLVQSNPLAAEGQNSLMKTAEESQRELHSWMQERNSTSWSSAVPFTMYQLNTCSSSNQPCSYRRLFNMMPRLGISSLHMIDGSLESVKTEDQLLDILHKALKDRIADDEHNSDTTPDHSHHSDDASLRTQRAREDRATMIQQTCGSEASEMKAPSVFRNGPIYSHTAIMSPRSDRAEFCQLLSNSLEQPSLILCDPDLSLT